jgi:hypothetical protein
MDAGLSVAGKKIRSEARASPQPILGGLYAKRKQKNASRKTRFGSQSAPRFVGSSIVLNGITLPLVVGTGRRAGEIPPMHRSVEMD